MASEDSLTYARRRSVLAAPVIGTLVAALILARSHDNEQMLAVGLVLLCAGCYASWASWTRPVLEICGSRWRWRKLWYQPATTIDMDQVRSWAYLSRAENLELTLQKEVVRLDLSVLAADARAELVERLEDGPISGSTDGRGFVST